MVGGTASLLSDARVRLAAATEVTSRGSRALGVGALLAALAIYGAVARHLPGLPSALEPVFYVVFVLPAFAGAVWLALPLARAQARSLLALTAIAGALALVFVVVDVEAAASVAKLACYALAGFAFLSLFEELWWLTLVALLVPWVDIWSVAAGPTEYVVEERPGIFEAVAVTFPTPGDSAAVGVGPPDILFFALFLATAARFGLRVAATWAAMSALLGATLLLVWKWDDLPGLPALPAVCLGFLVANAALLWRDLRRLLARPSGGG